MKTRIFVSVVTATLFVAASISVGAATMSRTSAKNMYNNEVKTESKEMLMEKTGTQYGAEEVIDTLNIRDRERLQDGDSDCDQDQIRDMDRDRLQDCDPDCDQDQVRDRDRLQDCETISSMDQEQLKVMPGAQEQIKVQAQEMTQKQQQVQTQEMVQEQIQEQVQSQSREQKRNGG